MDRKKLVAGGMVVVVAVLTLAGAMAFATGQENEAPIKAAP